jgi:hemerythrin-like domain-containing protein
MSQISEYLTESHRLCDTLFSELEDFVASKEWEGATKKFDQFSFELNSHLGREESVLFPEFEATAGSVSGPTQVMRIEHDRIRAVLISLYDAITVKDMESFIGASETMHILIQQHNMKEEQILYSMADNLLARRGEEIVKKMDEYKTRLQNEHAG